MQDIGLSKMLVALRKELWDAQLDAEGKDIKFIVNDVELELQLTVTEKEGAEGGIKFWVLNAKAAAETSSQAVQKIKLKLSPKKASGGPVEVSDRDTRPK